MRYMDTAAAIESGSAGERRMPGDFEAFWGLRRDGLAEGLGISLAPVDIPSEAARYHELVVALPGGRELRARYVRPATDEPVPLVVMFPDTEQGVRGWHHLTRFVALGQAVAMLDGRDLGLAGMDLAAGWDEAPEGLALAGLVTDALRLTRAALGLPGIDCAHASAFGDGLGGGLAIAVAALLGDASWRVAACNPQPADLRRAVAGGLPSTGPLASIARRLRQTDPTHERMEALMGALDYVDVANFATLLQGSLLVGTGLMDEVAPASCQDSVMAAATGARSVRRVTYPRHAHERINEFENELLAFLA